MKNTDILKKTMPFVWTRFGLYLALNIGLIVYLIVVLMLCIGLGGGSIGTILILIAIAVGLGIYIKISGYINYLVKAAHVAVISELSVNGSVPEGTSIVKYGQEQVKKRFVATTVFYGIDALVSGAVKQIQNMISKVGSWFGNIEAIQNIVKIINIFVGIVLGYVDEAVLARIFYKKEEGAWKGAADGVVLYFQNWKEILKNAVGIVVFVIIFYAVGTAATYGLTYGLVVAIAEENILATIVALVAGYLLIDAVKQSFVDSYITISVVNKYMSVTVNQTPAVDLYEKAKGWSRKFKELCGKAETEIATAVAAPAATTTISTGQPTQPVQMSQPVQPQVVQPTQPVQMAQPVQPQVVQPTQPVQMSQPVQPQIAPVEQTIQPTVVPTTTQNVDNTNI